MITPKNKIYFIHFLIVLLTVFNADSQAQTKTFDGVYTLKNGLEGIANFNFYLDKKDTIKQGNFTFLNIDESNEIFEAVEIKGTYNNNVKNGKWEYGFKNFKKETLSTIENNRLVYATSGTQKIITGSYLAGKANGNWQLLEQKVENAVSTDTLSFVKTTYSNGKLIGEIIAFNKEYELTGFTNKEGFADKDWKIEHKKTSTTEVRIYDNGILKKHCFVNQGDTTICSYVGFDEDVTNSNFWENIDVGKKYFKLLNFKNLGVNATEKDIQDLYSNKVEKTNNFILQALNNLTEDNSVNIGNFTEGSSAIEKVQVKVLKQPFTKEEKNQINTSQELYSKNKTLLDEFFNNSDVELSKYTNEDLMIHFEIMTTFKKKHQDLKSFFEKVSKPEYEYINRNAFLQQAFPNLTYDEKIKYTFKEKEYITTHSFPKTTNNKEDKFEMILEHLFETNSELKKLQKVANNLLAKSAKELDLVPYEKQMIALKDSIVKLYSNEAQLEIFNQYHNQAADIVMNYTESEVKKYSELPLEEKLESVKALNNCFENIVKYFDAQAEIPKKIERLDEVYTRTVFNPYTFTNMDERMKERLYKAYENHLLPFVLNDMTVNFNCSSVELKYNNFEKLYRKMMILRDRDTKEIEKDLRKVSNPDLIMKIIELEIDVN